jgi:hypothetical protein
MTSGTDEYDDSGYIVVTTIAENISMSNLSEATPTAAPEHQQRRRLVGGLIMIGIGLYLFAAQFIQAQWMGLLVMPALGLIFSAGGLAGRNAGLLVPGGILSGIGLGTYLVTGPYADASEVTRGAIVLLCFAAGWALITFLSALIGQRVLWPLIPGGIMAVIGGLLLAGQNGLTVLEWTGRLWPLALIVGGLAVLIRRR